MRHLVREDLGLESRVVARGLLLTPNAEETRQERCLKLINKLKASQPHQVQIFPMKKSSLRTWPSINGRNSRYLTDLPLANVNPSPSTQI